MTDLYRPVDLPPVPPALTTPVPVSRTPEREWSRDRFSIGLFWMVCLVAGALAGTILAL